MSTRHFKASFALYSDLHLNIEMNKYQLISKLVPQKPELLFAAFRHETSNSTALNYFSARIYELFMATMSFLLKCKLNYSPDHYLVLVLKLNHLVDKKPAFTCGYHRLNAAKKYSVRDFVTIALFTQW
jgi:hypothetical protein